MWRQPIFDYTAANLLYAKSISKGRQDPLTYCPDRGLTRGEMATLLIRAPESRYPD